MDTTRFAGYRDLVMLKTLYYTGLRAGELANLKVSDLDEGLRVLRVREGKGRKDRVVPVHPYLRRCLEEYLARKKDNSPYLFSGPSSRGFTKQYVSYVVKKYARRANLPERVSTHWLRHSFATHLVQRKVKVHYIAELLGHDSVDTTLLYTHRSVTELRELVGRV